MSKGILAVFTDRATTAEGLIADAIRQNIQKAAAPETKKIWNLVCAMKGKEQFEKDLKAHIEATPLPQDAAEDLTKIKDLESIAHATKKLARDGRLKFENGKPTLTLDDKTEVLKFSKELLEKCGLDKDHEGLLEALESHAPEFFNAFNELVSLCTRRKYGIRIDMYTADKDNVTIELVIRPQGDGIMIERPLQDCLELLYPKSAKGAKDAKPAPQAV